MTERPPPRSAGMIQPRVSTTPRPLMQDRTRPGAFQATVLTLFPGLFPGPLEEGVTGKALKEGLWALQALDIRRFARDKHRTVDDTPAGGGAGMVMKADVLARAIDFAAGQGAPGPVLCLSPRGQRFDQAMATRLAEGPALTLVCGRYEGIDQRVIDARGLIEVSVGDFVLTGGEIAAMAVLDATIRLRPGVLGNAASAEEESFARGLLEHPHYTRPQAWEGRSIPEVLLSGHHARIADWRRNEAERLTEERRPDLWRAYRDPEGAAEQSDARNTALDGGQEKDDTR